MYRAVIYQETECVEFRYTPFLGFSVFLPVLSIVGIAMWDCPFANLWAQGVSAARPKCHRFPVPDAALPRFPAK